jgi:hypothetical protein
MIPSASQTLPYFDPLPILEADINIPLKPLADLFPIRSFVADLKTGTMKSEIVAI